jgi:hypothetical protein
MSLKSLLQFRNQSKKAHEAFRGHLGKSSDYARYQANKIDAPVPGQRQQSAMREKLMS